MDIKTMNTELRGRCDGVSKKHNVECNANLLYDKRFDTYELHYNYCSPEVRNGDGDTIKDKYVEAGTDYCSRRQNETSELFEKRTQIMIEKRMFKLHLLANDMIDPKTGMEYRKW